MKNQAKSKKVKVFILAAVIGVFSLSSCGGGGDGVGAALNCDIAWGKQIEKDLNNYLDAIGAYSNDPSPQNCTRYKNATLDYIKALKKVKKCVPSSSVSLFNQSLQQAEQDVKDLNC